MLDNDDLGFSLEIVKGKEPQNRNQNSITMTITNKQYGGAGRPSRTKPSS